MSRVIIDLGIKNNKFCIIPGLVQFLKNLENPGILLSVAFSRTGKSWKNASAPGKFWQSVELK